MATEWESPEFVEIKMDAEISSYQLDVDTQLDGCAPPVDARTLSIVRPT
jgi:hypothetical protein